jgi:hypothetical protein
MNKRTGASQSSELLTVLLGLKYLSVARTSCVLKKRQMGYSEHNVMEPHDGSQDSRLRVIS